MDIREAGTKSDFYFRAKVRLIDVLLSSLKMKNAKILDIGCGTGEDLGVLNKYGRVYAIDTDKKTLDMLPRHLYAEKKLCSIENIDYPSSSFDIIVAFDAIEHVKNDKKAISEILRLLHSGGYFVFTVPAFQALYSTHDKAVGHYRRYSVSMLTELLGTFQINKLGYWNSSLFPAMAMLRFIRRSGQKADTMMSLPPYVNSLFYYILSSENLAVKFGIPMPIGLSIYGICKKTNKEA